MVLIPSLRETRDEYLDRLFQVNRNRAPGQEMIDVKQAMEVPLADRGSLHCALPWNQPPHTAPPGW